MLALEQATALPFALTIVMGAALLLSLVANRAHAQNNDALADEASVAKEALDASAHVLQKVMTGVPLEKALEELPHDPEAVDAFQKALAWARTKLAKPAALLLLAISLSVSGCTSEQFTNAESAAKSDALRAASGVQATAAAVQSNEATVDELAASAELLATLVASRSPQAASDLRAAASVAKGAPAVAPLVGNIAGAIVSALK